MDWDLDKLISAEQDGSLPDLLLFWGHRRKGDQVGPEVLSQWWEAPFVVDGVLYQSCEMFMMHKKSLLFNDMDVAAQILAAPSPKAAKELGRKVKDYDDDLWSAQRLDVVVEGNLAKFSQHPDLLAYLLGTGDKVLVEASPYDRIWGIGLGRDHADAATPSRWRGTNLLGFALMRVREALKSTPSGPDLLAERVHAVADGAATPAAAADLTLREVAAWIRDETSGAATEQDPTRAASLERLRRLADRLDRAAGS